LADVQRIEAVQFWLAVVLKFILKPFCINFSFFEHSTSQACDFLLPLDFTSQKSTSIEVMLIKMHCEQFFLSFKHYRQRSQKIINWGSIKTSSD
jgi:hypothetical protein